MHSNSIVPFDGVLSAEKKLCTDVVLNGIAVPAERALDQASLAKGTTVSFQGITTFGRDYRLCHRWQWRQVVGKGGDGGKTKPKFFEHCLTLNHITIDNLAGDAGSSHNTNALDIGSSDVVNILNANVINQDDCLAVNSCANIEIAEGFILRGVTV
ncbi:hypothetical protein F5Y05DRAFT_411889 [Hypoxylon sp. FL0543]|nr:hypothetical protein F5Y05DRAFT_411889 [Hypoxylon sp. FL0543]